MWNVASEHPYATAGFLAGCFVAAGIVTAVAPEVIFAFAAVSVVAGVFGIGSSLIDGHRAFENNDRQALRASSEALGESTIATVLSFWSARSLNVFLKALAAEGQTLPWTTRAALLYNTVKQDGLWRSAGLWFHVDEAGMVSAQLQQSQTP